MNETSIEVFLELLFRQNILNALNTSVEARKITFITSVSGAGRTALLEAWAKAEDRWNTTIIVELGESLHASIPNICVLFSFMWHELRLRLHAAEGFTTSMDRMPSLDDPKTLYTTRQALDLYFGHILPALDSLHISAIVVDNAQFLDAAGLAWLLNMRTPSVPYQRRTAKRALLLSARARPNPTSKHALLKVVEAAIKANPALRQPWASRVILNTLTIEEFSTTWEQARKIQLRAHFDEQIPQHDQDRLTALYWQRTGGNWWNINALLDAYYKVLGASKHDDERIITVDVIKRVHERLERIEWVTAFDSE